VFRILPSGHSSVYNIIINKILNSDELANLKDGVKKALEEYVSSGNGIDFGFEDILFAPDRVSGRTVVSVYTGCRDGVELIKKTVRMIAGSPPKIDIPKVKSYMIISSDGVSFNEVPIISEETEDRKLTSFIYNHNREVYGDLYIGDDLAIVYVGASLASMSLPYLTLFTNNDIIYIDLRKLNMLRVVIIDPELNMAVKYP